MMNSFNVNIDVEKKCNSEEFIFSIEIYYAYLPSLQTSFIKPRP